MGSGGRRNGWTVRQGRWWSGGPGVTMGITMTAADELVQERSRQGSESLQRRQALHSVCPKWCLKRSEKIQASLQPLQQAMLIWSDASKTKSEAIEASVPNH